ncbi:hypothetical protein BpHYR1_035693 [Brachionus plicatilis]|uniref:Uncharacterized protein n=1 Tax=Brachionus plicatilis TaxID=10195 RepID=A0A3M7QM95_BRAPC|nr:hypothetical protein BpHYR1_035693 [Brachionus plicatilis]
MKSFCLKIISLSLINDIVKFGPKLPFCSNDQKLVLKIKSSKNFSFTCSGILQRLSRIRADFGDFCSSKSIIYINHSCLLSKVKINHFSKDNNYVNTFGKRTIKHDLTFLEEFPMHVVIWFE